MLETALPVCVTLIDQTRTVSKDSIRRGPPNRMNDLNYTEWMKFQKSFFWHNTFQCLVVESIYFFTKAEWENMSPSRSLIAGFDDFSKDTIAKPRIVDVIDIETASSAKLILFLKGKENYDFALVNLNKFIRSAKDLSNFIRSKADDFFRHLRKAMVTNRYCGLVIDSPEDGGGGFPTPWSIALSARKYFRLRDEKIGLINNKGKTYYYILLHANSDERPADNFLPQKIVMAKRAPKIPAWIIPKSPPRKKGEILHPAKFPETLVTQFIELFSPPDGIVFDPMAGTGSTLIAAVRSGRDATGIELNSKFVEIANSRLAEEYPNLLFKGMDKKGKGIVLQGDALQLSSIKEVRDLKFDYCITSPPYWSVLRNPGSEYQRSRKERNLLLTYSDDERDLGNIAEYDQFLDTLVRIYEKVAAKLSSKAYMTIIVKNIKRNHVIYPLAWDLVARLCRRGGAFEYTGNTFWCQDDISVKPFAVGIYWVSNTLHHYCLHFKKSRIENNFLKANLSSSF